MKIRDREFSRLSTDQLYAILRLRVDVFVVEQECAYPELDDRDQESGTRHISIDDNAGVRGYLRLLDDGDARRIGRVVTRVDARNNGLAGALVDYTVEHSEGPWVLDAQSYLVTWYQDRGFMVDGEEFVEDGIPHVPMRREV
ncbi:MAG: GNAT family N-acetyltransferase [Acidimicrobiales bacterium]|nr:GNAT family N-acetyltransferase [Acidimicrobiales bacterium]MDG2217241.1 GNAT family N-acetyltransferase [Acidimicrobiales bacterium]